MKIRTRLLLAVVALCCAVTGHATNYEASTVTMKTLGADYAMSLLGATSDGYQVWAYQCTSSSLDLKEVEWQIDGGKTVSFPMSYFGTNSKRTLQTSSVQSYYSYQRYLTTDALNSHFLKVTSQSTADFFTWDMSTSPKFISEFMLTGALSVEVASSQYSNNAYVQKLAWTYTGITNALIDHLNIEASYDQGKTWALASTSTGDATSCDVQVSMDKNYVRYRVTAYVKDGYKIVADKDCYVAETTKDYDISATQRVKYNASKVVMNTGSGTGTDISMTKIGTSYDGYQIWACQGINSYVYTQWRIDGNDKLSYTVADYMSNTEYTLTTDYGVGYFRKVPEGTQHYHFIKAKGSEAATYFTWYGTKQFEAYGYFLSAKCTVQPNTDISLDESTNKLKQDVKWNFSGVSGTVIDHVSLDISYDGGNTWNNVDTNNNLFGNASTYDFTLGVTAQFDEQATQVRYRTTVYPKDAYKCVVENGYWRAETEDYPITIEDATCEIKAVKLDRSAFSTDEQTGKRTYTAEVSWTAYEDMADKFGGAEIQYSTDGGNTWTTTETVTTNTGTQSVKVPTGYTAYMFRICTYAKDALANIAAYRTTAVSDSLTTSYDPAVASLAVVAKDENLTYGQFRKITLNYMLNDELAQTCSRAYMYYSYDNGATWIKMKGFVPTGNGQHTVMVDASKSQCKFRLLVNAAINGVYTPCTLDTENITLN